MWKAVQYAKYYIFVQPYCCGGLLDTYLLTSTSLLGFWCFFILLCGLFCFRHIFLFLCGLICLFVLLFSSDFLILFYYLSFTFRFLPSCCPVWLVHLFAVPISVLRYADVSVSNFSIIPQREKPFTKDGTLYYIRPGQCVVLCTPGCHNLKWTVICVCIQPG